MRGLALTVLVLVGACERPSERAAVPVPAAASAPDAAAVPNAACAEKDCLPAFRVRTIDGRVVSTDDLRGKPALVMLAATWCEPCAQEGATLSSFHAARAGAGFGMLALWRDDADEDALRRFRDRYRIGYPVARVAADDPTFVAFGAPETVPTFVIYGADGREAARFTGALPAAILEREIDRLAAPAVR